MPFQHGEPLPRRLPQHGIGERRLAHARLPADQHQPALARFRGGEFVSEQPEFAFPACELIFLARLGRWDDAERLERGEHPRQPRDFGSVQHLDPLGGGQPVFEVIRDGDGFEEQRQVGALVLPCHRDLLLDIPGRQ